MKIKVSNDEELVKQIREGLKNNGGFCPCKLIKNEDTKCPCKEFREQDYEGECHCGLYCKIKE
jgi:ferredoxin-thioredoxin reductase catalytic subunit